MKRTNLPDLRKEVLKILIRDYRRGEIGDMTVRLENLIVELNRREQKRRLR